MSRTELIVGTGFLIATSFLANAALTQAQKDYIKRRDDRCQAKGIIPHTCDIIHPKEDHHIAPQMACRKKGINESLYDVPTNIVRICRAAHDIIHPDTPLARRNYRSDPKSFDKLQQQREGTLRQGKPYWRTTWDSLLALIANQSTQEYQAKHPEDKFPVKRRRI